MPSYAEVMTSSHICSVSLLRTDVFLRSRSTFWLLLVLRMCMPPFRRKTRIQACSRRMWCLAWMRPVRMQLDLWKPTASTSRWQPAETSLLAVTAMSNLRRMAHLNTSLSRAKNVSFKILKKTMHCGLRLLLQHTRFSPAAFPSTFNQNSILNKHVVGVSFSSFLLIGLIAEVWVPWCAGSERNLEILSRHPSRGNRCPKRSFATKLWNCVRDSLSREPEHCLVSSFFKEHTECWYTCLGLNGSAPGIHQVIAILFVLCNVKLKIRLGIFMPNTNVSHYCSFPLGLPLTVPSIHLSWTSPIPPTISTVLIWFWLIRNW